MNSFARIVALTALLTVPAVARAAVDCTAREPLLPHVCARGPNAGKTCLPDLSGVTDPLTCSVARPAQADACAGAKCTMVFEPGGNFSAEMLIIVDENVSQLDGGQTIQNGVALTVVFNLGKKGILSQTYQTLTGPDLTSLTTAPTDTFGVTLSEQRLRQETDLRPDGKAAIVNDILFRPQDAQLADALRALFLTMGTPVITKVSSVTLSDHPDGLATVLRLKVRGGFVSP